MDIYNKNFNTFKKGIEEDTRRGKNSPCSGINRINIVFLKGGYTTTNNLYIQYKLYQIPNVIFHRNRKIETKIHMEA
jgi:hypothetical protein